eukprot:TRINITY_DN262_c0_g2_i1.p1 TRINITY_DN262_c0_g2~~TRINITY_DN262_c0_g2_i1.p1  ORF type:complete len:102 (-),score=22.09 TRINITY_DN262_c0_g2_i1:200-505(-)
MALLAEVCSFLKGMGEAVRLTLTPVALTFEAQDDSLTFELSVSEANTGVHILCNEPQSQALRTRLFVELGRLAKLPEAKECLLQLGDDIPLTATLCAQPSR